MRTSVGIGIVSNIFADPLPSAPLSVNRIGTAAEAERKPHLHFRFGSIAEALLAIDGPLAVRAFF
jgi:hypothetical protein